MKRFKKEFVIGLAVLLSIVILIFGIDYLKGINLFHTANYYFVSYTDVGGLTQSAPVTINGYKVGIVREIQYEFDNPGHIRVELSLDRKLKVPRGSKAILGADLLGTAHISLVLANDNGDFHDVGDVLVGENAKGLMDGLGESVMPAITDLIPRVDSLLSAVTTLASDPALLASIRRLDNITAGLESSSLALSRAMQPVPGITSAAATTMVDVKAVAANLDKISSDLAAVSAALKEAPLESTLDNFGKLSNNLLALSQQLNDPNSSLGLLMRDPQLYNNINNCAAHIDTLLLDIKRQPKRYIPSIKVF